MKNRRPSLLAATALACSLTTLTPNTATATPWPENCHDRSYPQNGWYAFCESGTGRYKASVVCFDLNGGPPVTRDALTWVPVGNYSIVHCPPLTWAEYGGILSRND